MLLVGILAAASVVLAAGEKMSVQVKSGQLRATPSFLGSVVATVAYADRVTVAGKQDPWFKVTDARGRTGWIHQSALTKKRIVLSAGTADAGKGVSGEELSLAGKGFNSQVEAEFKAENKDIDFTWVDRMGTFVVTPDEATAFLAKGEVEPVSGGAR
jgi:SH3-like domain-containing protein